MRDTIEDLLYLLITQPSIEVFSISSFDGAKKAIKRDYLRSRRAAHNFSIGFIPFSDGFRTSKEDGNFIFINKTQFEDIMSDRQIVSHSVNSVDKNMLSDKYIPPYIEFILQASDALEMSSEKRLNINIIKHWLRDNWPSELDGKSDRSIQSMATLLRRPEDKKGGNTSWN